MQVHINNISKDLKQEIISVSALLVSENILKTEGIAVAVNNQVVPKADWEKFNLKNNDKILIIRAAQGG